MFSAFCQNCRFTEENPPILNLKLLTLDDDDMCVLATKRYFGQKKRPPHPIHGQNDSHKASKSEISQFTKF